MTQPPSPPAPPPATPAKAAKPSHATLHTHIVPLLPILAAILIAVVAWYYARHHPLARHTHGPTSQQAATPGGGPGLAIGSTAPDFILPDAANKSVRLSALTRTGPVLVVFYNGYFCPRCVSNLRAIAERFGEFQRRNIRVVAISPDTPELSAEQQRKHGGFPFPLLADVNHATAVAYRVYLSPDEDFHAAYLIDGRDVIRFAHVGEHPFEDVEALLQAADAMGH